MKARFWILVVALGLGACRSDVQSGMQSANDLLYRQKYVDAERLYRKLLKRLDSSKELTDAEDAQRLQVLDRLGKINALYLRDYTQAIADYEGLIRHYPKAEQSLSALATVADLYHYKIANLQQGIDAYQRLVSDFPTRPEARHAQLETVAAYFKLKNYDQARTEAATLLKRWADSPEAMQAEFEVADTYYVQKRYTEAIATYELLLQRKPEANLTALVLFELGNCYQELGDGERALTYFYASLPAHPNPGLVQRKIARVRSRLHHTAPQSSIMNAVAANTRPRAARRLQTKTLDSTRENAPVTPRAAAPAADPPTPPSEGAPGGGTSSP